ncbi:MAG: NapC/NirT family cytochrome c [Bacillota bacterium]
MAEKPRSTRIKVAVGVFGLFILFALSLKAGKDYVNNSGFCGLCHEMRPEIVTWQASSHSKVECVECHGSVSFIPELNTHYQKSYLLPITLDKPLPDAKCTRCHAGKRHVSPSGDLIIPHNKHVRRKISCSECHSGAAHGNIAVRQMTIDGSFNRWTKDYGREQMAANYTGIAMDACIECHRNKKVTTGCEACHRQIVKPADHKTGEWTVRHGKQARKDIRSCDRCHSVTVVFEVTNIRDPVIEYIQTNTLCWQCHQKKPLSHTGNWSAQHGLRASTNRDGCMVCHSRTRPLNSFKGAKTFCMKCHQGKHQGFNRELHPIPVPLGTKPAAACEKCHNLKVCAGCHVSLSSKNN